MPGMAIFDARRPRPSSDGDPAAATPLAGTRSQAMQRLQVGLFGLASMVLLVGLASIIKSNVRENEARVVPEAAPAVAAPSGAEKATDPLVDAGVVPAMPAEPAATSSPAPVEIIHVPDIQAP